MEEFTVTILPEVRAVKVKSGTLAGDAARAAGAPLNMQCGGKGRCGKCSVGFADGAPEPSALELELLGEARIAAGERLGCRAKIRSDATLCVPETSRLWHIPAAKEQSRFAVRVDLHPAVARTSVKLPPPSTEDPAPDAARLLRSLPPGTLEPDFSLLRGLSGILRKNGFHITAVLRGRKIITIEPGAANHPLLGAAVDIGTTTLGARVIDLESGEELGSAIAPNPQAAYGADVASRAAYIAEHPEGLKTLHTRVVEEVNRMLNAVSAEAKVKPSSIMEVALAGNPTMVHIFLGVDPGPIAVSPFTPATAAMIDAPAKELGLTINKRARLVVLPSVAGYVGADAVAALLSATAPQTDIALPALLIDLGTNAEIMLLTEDGSWACAAAAGPALEGAQLSCGMGAYPGAVDSVSLLCGDIKFTTISGSSPIGVCGTGALDLLAGLLESGVIEPSGRFANIENWPEAMRANFYEDEKRRPAFRIAGSAGSPMGLTQADARQLQLARAAILAGASVLMDAAGVSADKLGSVLLAGALGTFMTPATALRAGIVPKVPENKIRFIGNAALEGARRALLNVNERERAARLAKDMKYIELSGNRRFSKEFERCMPFAE